MRLKIKKRYLPQSSLGKAIDYTLGQWSGLGVFLENGRVEIDNNLVENAIRPTAVGKKNWLFVGDIDAGQRGAILYTIIENCRRQSIDPYAYLREVLTKLPTLTNQNIANWTPAAYAHGIASRAVKPTQSASTAKKAPCCGPRKARVFTPMLRVRDHLLPPLSSPMR